MEYNNQLALSPTAVTMPTASQELICPHCQTRLTEQSVPPPRKPKTKRLWVDAVQVLELTQALALAKKAVEWTEQPLLKRSGRTRGAPKVYSDATVLLTFLIAKLWHLSYEEMLGWLGAWPRLARALGYPKDAKTGRLRLISLGSYSKRLASLNLKVYFAFFVLLVGQLVKAGIISGYDLIMDSTIVRAWSQSDRYCAISYKYRDVNKRFGIKVHTLLDRISGLPIMVGLSPANANDGPFGLPLLQAAIHFFKLRVGIVRGDSAYDSKALWHYVVRQLGAIWAVDYNLRRSGKKKLADREAMRRWRWFMRPRATIERFFRWVKSYYQLKYFKVQGHSAIMRHVIATYTATLFVGWVAAFYKRPDLMRSPSRVLAYFDA
jgi:hypothetical protein